MTPITLNELAHRYDAFLIDQFGVLLNGKGAYEFAPAALSRLAQTGKPILLLSNSGKRSAPNEARLSSLGFARGSYLAVLSSGEVAYAILSQRLGSSIPCGARVWCHGRDEDTSPIDGLPLVPTANIEDANLIILAGSQSDALSLEDYRVMLEPAAKRNTPCLCTNPDMEMLTQTGKRFGAGRIARLYEELGGAVEWIGKPHRAIYEEAGIRLGNVPAGRVACLGDSPAHDIAGGKTFGHATVLLRTGLYEKCSLEEIAAMHTPENPLPDFILPRFEFTRE